MTADPLQDEPLLRRLASRDRAAFEVLMRRYNRRLYRLAYACLRGETEAQDVVQETYLNAYRSIGDFRGESSVATWLSRLVLNECHARQRRHLRRENVIPMVSSEANMSAVDAVADDAEPREGTFGRAQMRGLLERKVAELPEAFRLVFVLRAVEELSVAETAECLGIAEETVRSRHFRARGLLRESLAQDVDLAVQDLFEFDGPRCDGIIATVLARLPEREPQQEESDEPLECSSPPCYGHEFKD
jgi:RNA polymerase sigma factor (sigma-70 family)